MNKFLDNEDLDPANLLPFECILDEEHTETRIPPYFNDLDYTEAVDNQFLFQ